MENKEMISVPKESLLRIVRVFDGLQPAPHSDFMAAFDDLRAAFTPDEIATGKMKPRYRHTEDMGEISGFGGGYEEACQDMLEAGVRWLDEHKSAELQAHGFKGVYGIMVPDSPDATALSKVITGSVEECTGAMHQAVLSRLFFIAKNGWDAYCAELRKDAKEAV